MTQNDPKLGHFGGFWVPPDSLMVRLFFSTWPSSLCLHTFVYFGSSFDHLHPLHTPTRHTYHLIVLCYLQFEQSHTDAHSTFFPLTSHHHDVSLRTFAAVWAPTPAAPIIRLSHLFPLFIRQFLLLYIYYLFIGDYNYLFIMTIYCCIISKDTYTFTERTATSHALFITFHCTKLCCTTFQSIWIYLFICLAFFLRLIDHFIY